MKHLVILEIEIESEYLEHAVVALTAVAAGNECPVASATLTATPHCADHDLYHADDERVLFETRNAPVSIN